MATNNNINGFNAADIEKYHKGLLSNNERHALEKAALDDPFLADALEGYATPGIDLSADMKSLKARLAQRIEKEEDKVIPIGNSNVPRMRWMRVAAAVVLIAGAGLLANQFIFKNSKDNNIAQADKQSTPANNNKDSVTPAVTATSNETANASNATTGGNSQQDIKTAPDKDEKNTAANLTTINNGHQVQSETAANNPVTKPAPVAAGNITTGEVKLQVPPGAPVETKDIARLPVEKKVVAGGNAGITIEDRAKEKLITEAEKDGTDDRATALRRKADEQRYRQLQNNIFRGRVTDANNAGVPFANVSNIEDKVGTYTDVNGYFNLTSPDSVMNVQVRSIGFENNQVQLKNTAANTKITLREDRNLSTVVISNQKPNVAARNRDANRTLTEPEPADGWDNYDVYLANNLDIPEDVKTKQAQTGTVQVSFEVDRYGEPVNFRVEKSLCDKCDKEAIRLIKQGPKWKRNAAAKGRTTVTINF